MVHRIRPDYGPKNGHDHLRPLGGHWWFVLLLYRYLRGDRRGGVGIEARAQETQEYAWATFWGDHGGRGPDAETVYLWCFICSSLAEDIATDSRKAFSRCCRPIHYHMTPLSPQFEMLSCALGEKSLDFLENSNDIA